MKFLAVALFVASVVQFGQSRNLWSADLPEVRYNVLEKGKPIQLDRDYPELQISGITGTVFSDSLSKLQNVKVLRLSHNQINNIEKGAIGAAPDVRTLELDFYESKTPPVLTKDVFENSGNIEQLIIRFNDDEHQASKIEVDALENLTSLKELSIQGHNITHLRKNFLQFDPSRLTHLTLSICNIEEIDSDVFEDLKNLEELSILRNLELTTIPENLFRGLSKLTKLNLRENGIKDLTWAEFEGLTSLEELNISANRITSFDADKIATNLPNLKSLSIDQNPPRCKEKQAVVEQLKNKLPNLKDVTYKFDPGYYDSCEERD